MSRNASGTYSLPLPAVTPGTLITAAWANTTLADIAQALTDSLDREGRGGMNAPMRVDGGTAVNPGYAFNAGPSTGLYSNDASHLGFTVLGVELGAFDSTGLTLDALEVTGATTFTGAVQFSGTVDVDGNFELNSGAQILADDGTLAEPAYSFLSDPDTGIQRTSTYMGLGYGGVSGFRVYVDRLLPLLQTQFPNGSVAAPSISFLNDPDMGLYRIGADILGASTAGVEAFRVDASQRFVKGGIAAQSTILGATTVTPPMQLHGASVNTTAYLAVNWSTAGTSTPNYLAAKSKSGAPGTFGGTALVANDILANLSFAGDDGTAFVEGARIAAVVDAAPSAGRMPGRFDFMTASASAGVSTRMSVTSTDITTTVPFLVPDGSVAAPSYSFSSDPDTGIYHSASNVIGFATNGVSRALLGTVSLTLVDPIVMRTSDGDATVPGYSFTNDTNLGFYRPGADVVSIAGNGLEQFRFDAATPLFYIGGIVAPFSRFSVNQWRYTPAAATGGTILIDPLPDSGQTATVQLFRNTNTTGTVQFMVMRGDNTTDTRHYLYGNNSTGLGARLCDDATQRAIIGNMADDTVSRLQVTGRLKLLDAAASGLTPNSNYDSITVESAGNTGITMLSNGAAPTFGIVFGTSDNVLDGRIHYTRSTRAMTFYTANTLAFTIASDGRLFGSDIHNNAGAMTGTTSQYIGSGTYTPVATAITNIDSTSGWSAQWIRVGNVVTVSGTGTVNATTAGDSASFRLSLPIASALAAVGDLGGVGACAPSGSGDDCRVAKISAIVANDQALFEYDPGTNSDALMTFTFTYEVL